MQIRHFLLSSLLLIGLFAAIAPARAGGTVQLTLVGDTQSSALSFQEWSQALSKAGIRNVRIRSGSEDDKARIVTEGSGNSPVYVVTGIINSRNEIVVPGARFRRSDVTKLAVWLKDLAENGPAAGRAPKSSLGLTGGDFNNVRKDLATAVDFSTVGMSRQKAVEKIAGLLKQPVQLDAEVARALGSDKLEDELSGLSCGTALACVLRPAGYSMAPRAAGGQIVYVVAKSEGRPSDSNMANISLATLKTWPVGWTTDKSDQAAVPELYAFRTVNVQNVSAATALEAIAKRAKVPVLLDHKGLTKHNIDPAKVQVSFPSKRTTYSIALGRMLFQARLKFQVRYDDAGTPFLWVTTNKPAD
jgi:hypothetical protein